MRVITRYTESRNLALIGEPREVEYTEAEAVAVEQFDALLDRGQSVSTAAHLVLLAMPVEERSAAFAERLSDKTLTIDAHGLLVKA